MVLHLFSFIFSAPGNTSPFKGLKKYVPDIKYETGCGSVKCGDESLIEAATKAAAVADASVLVVGLDLSIEAEGLDREDLTLPGFQGKLVKQVANSTNGTVILVAMSAGPIDVSFAKSLSKIAGIIWDDVLKGQAIDVSTVNCQNSTFDIVIGVKNSGPRDGSHVVLVFWKPASSKDLSGAPSVQLAAFERVEVKNGKTGSITVKMNVCKVLNLVDSQGKRNLVIGQHTIIVGSPSERQVKRRLDVRFTSEIAVESAFY
ncbi:Glycoside hydrolase [Trema orientale]|uniref:Glycoside hydrolase n=1 Tax=Trema orientale TaxID=63057 RepID=A0A2P5EYD8_TREOI|nr:Glycoside hydrolase [Trema orientale]